MRRGACKPCRDAHAACTQDRPCVRCASKGIDCVDGPDPTGRKRGRPPGWEMTPEDEARKRLKQKQREEAIARQLLSEQEILTLSSLPCTYSIEPSKLPPLPPPAQQRQASGRFNKNSKAFNQIRKENTEIEEKLFELELKLREQREKLEQGKKKIEDGNAVIEDLITKLRIQQTQAH